MESEKTVTPLQSATDYRRCQVDTTKAQVDTSKAQAVDTGPCMVEAQAVDTGPCMIKAQAVDMSPCMDIINPGTEMTSGSP